MGKTATILVKPQLLINGKRASLELLQNVKCELTTVNYIDGIPSTKVFNDVHFSYNNEYLLKFQVCANISQLSVKISAELKNINKNIMEVYTADHNFNIISHSENSCIGEFYFKLNGDQDYEILLLGKNGEAIKSAHVKLSYNPTICQKTENIEAITNDQGLIKLGKLKGVKDISAVYNESAHNKLTGSWVLPSQNLIQYPNSIDIIEGENIDLPIAAQDIDEKLLLRSVYENSNIANCSNLIKINKEPNELYGTIHIEGLKANEYVLTGIQNERIQITVHEGVYWTHNPNFILKKNSLLENREKNGFIKIKSVNFEEAKGGKVQMNMEINGATKDNWRVHVMLFKYLPDNLNELTMNLLDRDYYRRNEYPFQKWENFYLSGRELSSDGFYSQTVTMCRV